MENVIKQGYLKKGNSTEGGVFSGFIEKMTSKKWYMLVVRSRVPFLEQYDRDVDVFSTAPSMSYELSDVTSISRTMATSARTFNFVIVCPDQMIELVAASREQMKDWCDVLERTLKSLGVLRDEKEEHLYTFCPAVSNLFGHSNEKRDIDDDEEQLGAVGGASMIPSAPSRPAPPSNHPAIPPPLPGNHPSLLSKASSEQVSTLNDLSPPPLPSHVPPPLRKTAQPSLQLAAGPPTTKAPPVPTSPQPLYLPTNIPVNNSFAPLSPPPLPPLPPLPPVPHSPTFPRSMAPPPPPPSSSLCTSNNPPPLPPSRQGSGASSSPVGAKPPPLPPGRPFFNVIDPPLGPSGSADVSKGITRPPKKSDDIAEAQPKGGKPDNCAQTSARENTAPSIGRTQPGSAVKKISLSSKSCKDSSDLETSDTDDYTGDFVSGAFWEINRKIPVPTARRATIPRQAAMVARGGSGNNDEDKTDKEFSSKEDLDEGYQDLTAISSLMKSTTSDQLSNTSSQYSKVMKKSASDSASIALISSTADTCESDQTLVSGPADVKDCSPVKRKAEASGRRAADSGYFPCGDESSRQKTLVIENRCRGEPKHDCSSTENVYAPFPTHSEETDSEAQNDDDDHYDNAELARGEEAGQNETYVCASDASSLPHHPPLPTRLDSLPILFKDSVNEHDMVGPVAASAHGIEKSIQSDSVSKPFPTHRRIPQTASASAGVSENGYETSRTESVSAHFGDVTPLSQSHCSMTASASTHARSSAPSQFTDIPPLPPRRGAVLVNNRGQSSDHTKAPVDPPPLPSRKTQSFYLSPRSSLSSAESDSYQEAPGADSQLASSSTSKRRSDVHDTEAPSPTVHISRHQSIGSGDITENCLRQRMRVDREHSGQSVISLKQSQVEILRQEMELPGVIISVTVRAALAIALVDCAEAVCVAGWNQKDYPSLHGKLHIGDQLLSICNLQITGASMAYKMLKHPPSDPVEILVKRTPYAKVLALRRAAEGENIGIKRNGGTAEIQYVDPNGLAAANGLSTYAPGILASDTRNTWMLTEINSRHLSLFFKEYEIEHRLNAVGREITILVQPSDYILEIKKQLKKMKNYKNFIVQ